MGNATNSKANEIFKELGKLTEGRTLWPLEDNELVIRITPWTAATAEQPLMVCERTPTFGNKWDKGISYGVVSVSAVGVRVMNPQGDAFSIDFTELSEKWMTHDGRPCGNVEYVFG